MEQPASAGSQICLFEVYLSYKAYNILSDPAARDAFRVLESTPHIQHEHENRDRPTAHGSAVLVQK